MIIKVRLKYSKLYDQGRNKEVGNENRVRKNGIKEKIKEELNNKLVKKCLTEMGKKKTGPGGKQIEKCISVEMACQK